ncbi:hypothetical protein LG290_04755 [Halomonas sediminis]|uniref:Uncharacterized protein n=1 Tax=Vreelandella zhuhanensis TaxID=2684210 RepID=A0A7X3GY26_9GAMM|nr:hypothetical protein [Halomonas zhuhanensis]MWJ27007.1 hypothetical protein [Halomonas zhuhanensis]
MARNFIQFQHGRLITVSGRASAQIPAFNGAKTVLGFGITMKAANK